MIECHAVVCTLVQYVLQYWVLYTSETTFIGTYCGFGLRVVCLECIKRMPFGQINWQSSVLWNRSISFKCYSVIWFNLIDILQRMFFITSVQIWSVSWILTVLTFLADCCLPTINNFKSFLKDVVLWSSWYFPANANKRKIYSAMQKFLHVLFRV